MVRSRFAPDNALCFAPADWPREAKRKPPFPALSAASARFIMRQVRFGTGLPLAVARDRMKMVRYPHPSLRYPARPLTAIHEEVRTAALHVLDLIDEATGI